MGNFQELKLLPSYRKEVNNIAHEFYLPSMSTAKSYKRSVGFFNSAIYMIAWSSLKDFVNNNGKIQIICSPVLSSKDIDAIKKGYADKEEINTKRIIEEIRKLLDDSYLKKPTKVLASLIAMDVIDFRIAFMDNVVHSKHRRLFHDKVGIFEDEYNNKIVFKGSMNESWSGLSEDGNLESVDVFISWGGKREEKRVNEEIQYFDSLWDNKFSTITVKKFPDIAIKELISTSDLHNWSGLVDDICIEIESFATISADRTLGKRIPRPHQVNALKEWFKQDRRGILEHATGSGKTFTALCAIRDSIEKEETPLVLVPSEILLHQWKDEIKTTFKDINLQLLICGAGNNRWRQEQLLHTWSLKSDKPRIILATMQTASTKLFLSTINQGTHLFLVADEVHRLGSLKHQNIFSLNVGPRLGLSATPRRAGDPEGTDAILNFFNGIINSPFTLYDAIDAKMLTPYMYYVHPVSLTANEQDEWGELTKKIHQYYARYEASQKKDDKLYKRITQLAIDRARITKKAFNKNRLAIEVINEHYETGEKWIIYCDSQEQLYTILEQLRTNSYDAIDYHSAMNGDRKQTLKIFEENGGIVVSIRCLDEGVDIPSVTHALILASSKNPREFIQRRGRVLRKASGKGLAFVHDALVIPNEIEMNIPGIAIVEGELARAIEFGKGAMNPSAISDLQLIALNYGLDYKQLLDEGFEDE